MKKNEKKYLEAFRQMIQFNTVTTGDKNKDTQLFKKFHKLLKELFPNLFAKAKVEDFNGSLLIKWAGKTAVDPILFMNHQDVVEATGDWKYPPFSATVADGKVWGRGTLDTKGGLFSMLQAADELIEKGFVPKQDIYFVSGCNEETSGEGARTIAEELKKRGIKFKFLIDEGGMIKAEPMPGVKGKYAMIGLGEKSSSTLKFTAKSTGGHASTPGANTPLVRLGKMMAYMDDNNIFKVEVNDIIVLMLKRFSLTMDSDSSVRKVYAQADKLKPILKVAMPKVSPVAKAMVQTTLAFTMAQGSNQTNVLPETACVYGDMRISHHQGYEKSLEAVRKIASKFNVEVEPLHGAYESKLADIHCEGFKIAEEAVKAIFGEDVNVAPYIMNQCSDAKYMSQICDNGLRFVPFIITDEQMKSIHGINENVDISNLSKAVDFYKYIMNK